MWLELLTVAQVLSAPSPQDADALRWDAPPECPSEAQMRERIEEAGGAGALRIEATPTRVDDETWRLVLSIELEGHRDRRTLEGPNCAALADALELLIAVRRDEVPPDPPEAEADDDHTVGAVPNPEVDPAATDTPTGEEVPPDPAGGVAPDVFETTAPVAPRRDNPRGLHIGIASGLGIGPVPFPAIPIELALGWSFARLRLAARGRYVAPQRITLDDGRGALVQMGVGGLEGCARPAIRTVEFPLCGQAAIGGSRATPRGGAERTRGGLWAEAGVDLGLAWFFAPRWALTARLGAAAVLAKTRFVVGQDLLFDPAPVVGRFVVGVETHIGSGLGSVRRRGSR